MKETELIARFLEAPKEVQKSILALLKYTNKEQEQVDYEDFYYDFAVHAIRAYLEEIVRIRAEIRKLKKHPTAAN